LRSDAVWGTVLRPSSAIPAKKIYELKFDGYRALIIKDKQRVPSLTLGYHTPAERSNDDRLKRPL
jgi:hypothetical protein